MNLLGDVIFSAESLGVITVLVGTLWGSVVVLWRHDLYHRERHLSDIRSQRDELWRVITRHGLSDRVPSHLYPPRARPAGADPETAGADDGPAS